MSPKSQSLASREVSKSGKVSPVDDLVARKKREVKDKLIAEIVDWIDRKLYLMAQIYGHTSNECGSSSGLPGGFTYGAGDGGLQKPPGGQKRSRRGDDHDESAAGGDEDGGDRGGSIKRSKKTSPNKRPLACPFFKHNPFKHGHRSSCTGPGWKDFHRLKEHINRVHVPAKYRCIRCRKDFLDGQALETHSRAKIACEVDDSQLVEELSAAQAEKLKKKSCGNVPDEERWKELYCLIFPMADVSAIPSPYYDHNERSKCKAAAEDMVAYTQHLRARLPNLVILEVDKMFEVRSDQIKEVMPDIIRNCLAELSKSFQTGRQRPTMKPNDDGEDETLPGEREQLRPAPALPAPAPLPSDAVADFMFNDMLNLDDAIFGHLGSYSLEGSDSGYSAEELAMPLEDYLPSTAS